MPKRGKKYRQAIDRVDRSKLYEVDEAVYKIELPDVRYDLDSSGRIFIESRQDYMARTGRNSPDDANALALANYGRYIAKAPIDINKIKPGAKPLTKRGKPLDYTERAFKKFKINV